MRKTTKLIAKELGLTPIPFWTGIRMILKGMKPGFCYGRKKGKGVRATIVRW